MTQAGPAADSTTPTADHPNVIIFPPLLLLLNMVAAFVLNWAIPLHWPWPQVPRWIGGVLVVAALSVMMWARRRFAAAGTNVNPGRPAIAIVDTGPFQFTRNPMYVGVMMAFAGVTLMFRWTWGLGLIVELFVVLQYGVIRREERYLTRKFGDAYTGYTRRVRRWL